MHKQQLYDDLISNGQRELESLIAHQQMKQQLLQSLADFRSQAAWDESAIQFLALSERQVELLHGLLHSNITNEHRSNGLVGMAMHNARIVREHSQRSTELYIQELNDLDTVIQEIVRANTELEDMVRNLQQQVAAHQRPTWMDRVRSWFSPRG